MEHDVFFDRLKKLLELHEGKKRFPYRCPAGKLTIGIGRNLEDKGLSNDEIDYLFKNDIRECVLDLSGIIKDFFHLDEVRQAALIDMRFNLGPGGFRSFKKFIKEVNNRNFLRASEEMRNSKWFRQVGERSKRLCKMMQDGKWWFETDQ